MRGFPQFQPTEQRRENRKPHNQQKGQQESGSKAAESDHDGISDLCCAEFGKNTMLLMAGQTSVWR